MPVKKGPKTITINLKKVKPASKPDKELLASLYNATGETKSGKAKPIPKNSFTMREPKQLDKESLVKVKTQPKWVRALVERKIGSEAMLERLSRRTLMAPSRNNLVVALNVLNDLGKKKGGGALMRKHVTQAVIDALAKKGV